MPNNPEDQETPSGATTGGQSENNNLELWKYFRTKGEADKERMITITTWLLTFSAAVLGYTFNKWIYFVAKCPWITTGDTAKVVVYCLLAIAILAYAMILIVHQRKRSRKNWLRSEILLSQIEGLEDTMKLKGLTKNLKAEIDKETNKRKKRKKRKNLKTIESFRNRYYPIYEDPPLFTSFFRINSVMILIISIIIMLVIIDYFKTVSKITEATPLC